MLLVSRSGLVEEDAVEVFRYYGFRLSSSFLMYNFKSDCSYSKIQGELISVYKTYDRNRPRQSFAGHIFTYPPV